MEKTNFGISRAIDLPTADRFQSRPAHVRVAADLHADGVTVVRPRAEPQRTGVLTERPVGQVHFAEHPVPGRRYPVHGAVGPDHAVGLAVRLVVVPVGAVENASRPRRPAVTTTSRGLYRGTEEGGRQRRLSRRDVGTFSRGTSAGPGRQRRRDGRTPRGPAVDGVFRF